MTSIVGLGNPGPRYARTRHNVGFLVLDELIRTIPTEAFATTAPAEVRKGRLGGETGEIDCLLVRPLTYMNLSGHAVAPFLGAPAEGEEGGSRNDLLVVVDDFYLPFGRLRLRPHGSDGGHNGLKSIAAVVGNGLWPRLRMGIGPLPEGVPAEEFVLEPFASGEEEALPEFVTRAAECVKCCLTDGVTAAMNRFNS